MERRNSGIIVFVMLSVVILVFSSVIDYSFFIIFVNAITIFLGLTIYIIAFYSKEFSKGSNYLYIGVAYLSISILDLFGIIDVGVFDLKELDINIYTQLWFATKFMEGFVLFHAYNSLIKKRSMKYKHLLISFGITTLLILLFTIYNNFTPALYYSETGYTLYKKVLDVLVILLYFVAISAVYKNESRVFNRRVLIVAILFKIFGESVFIFDMRENDLFGMLRYVSKYISYILLFMVFTRELLLRPYENIFRAFMKKEDELLELSKKDSLTSLYNHSTSYEKIREIIKVNQVVENNICLMMIDVDDFKRINDKHGHVKGDEILVRIADIFNRCDGPLELAGRYGGDEFVTLFVGCDGEKAKLIAEKLFTEMKKLSATVRIEVTLSIGIAEWQKGFTAKDLVKTADYQMYEAKSVGKNTYKLK